MGRKLGFRQVTMYVEPVLYERVKHSAYALDEDIYEFVDEALKSACERRTNKQQRDTIGVLVQQNIKNRADREKRR